MTHRIGCVFAHPDDETFCVGGIVAKYAAAGVPVDLFCATNGDAGKSASVPVSSREELAAHGCETTCAGAHRAARDLAARLGRKMVAVDVVQDGVR